MAAKRPKRIALGDVVVRAIRGPKPGDQRLWYWQAQRSFDGVRRTVWSGWATRTDATSIVLDLVAAAPVDDVEEEVLATWISTVRELTDLYVANLRRRLDVGDLTIYGFRNSRSDARHLAEHLGDIDVAVLRKSDIERYRNLRLADAAPSTVHRELKALRAAWKWAREDEHVPDRDLPKVGVKVTPVREKYNPSVAEIWRVVEHLKGWAKFVAGLQATTGARVGEIAGLRWEDVHFGSGHLTLRGKSGLREFPISDQVREVLSWGDRDAEHPHGTTPTMVLGHLSSRELVAACAAAGVRRFSSHGFRRAAVDTLQRAGVDIKTAADLLGHSPETMLKYYREVSTDDRRSAAELLGAASSAAFGRAAEPTPKPARSDPGSARRVTARGYSSNPEVRKSEGPQGLKSPAGLLFGTPKGNRTPVSGVRGQRPNR